MNPAERQVLQQRPIDLSQKCAGFTRYYLGQNRLRDLAISDDGKTIYVATDSQGNVQDKDGKEASGIENAGAILVYKAK